MSEGPLQIVCLMVGDALPDTYVDRLFRSLKRCCGVPFRLSCLTDRSRAFEEDIIPHMIQEEGYYRDEMRPTQHKLRLFESGGWPFAEFIYLDVTLIIKSDLSPLLSFFEASSSPLVSLRDWKWDTINSSVMRIRRDVRFGRVFEDYAAGVGYATRLKGDQDFLTESLRAHGLMAEVEFLPSRMVASYKELRRMHRIFSKSADAQFREAQIIKFHGSPRPMEIFDEEYWRAYNKENPLRAIRDANYLVEELRAFWI